MGGLPLVAVKLRSLQDGNTPLSLAVKKAHAGVVRALLERSEVDPNQADKVSPASANSPSTFAAGALPAPCTASRCTCVDM